MQEELIIEKRELERFIVNVKIEERDTGRCLGYSANMHKRGMMITSTEPLPLDRVLKVKLVHIQDEDEIIEIPLDIVGVWRTMDKTSGFHNTGFKIINTSPKQDKAINTVIEELAI